MPLNCIPATTSRHAAEQKLATLDGHVHVDVAFWGGVVPGNVGELRGLAEMGVPGAKCFLCPSGVSSRTFVEPYWSARMRSMKNGPSRSPTTSATSPAATMRKDG